MHNKLNQAWEEIESVQVEKFCETMDEVINSRDFERAFEIVLDKGNKYNKSYFLWLLWKIRNLQELEKKEKEDFLDLLDDDNFQEITKKVYDWVKWLTIKQAEHFLKFYSVEKMIFSLRDKANKRFLEILTYKYELEKEVEINWERFLKISKKGENWNVKKWVIKESEKEQAEEKCVFDDIWKIKEVNWEVYYIWKKWNKNWLIKYGDEAKAGEKCVFDDIWKIKEVNWEVYYIWEWNKNWLIKYGDEAKAEEKCIFDDIWKIKEMDWEVFYDWSIRRIGKRWRIKYWDEAKANDILVGKINEWSELEKNEKGVYFKYLKWFLFTRKKYISLKEEKENNWDDRGSYDWISV